LMEEVLLLGLKDKAVR